MGTNYYCDEEDVVCPTCNHAKNGYNKHIGKSSMGWCFSLHVYPEDGINFLDDWRKFLSTAGRIYDEYDTDYTVDELMSIITDRSHKGSWTEEDLAENSAVAGPNGLARHDSRCCVGHGKGTWDYIDGDFS